MRTSGFSLALHGGAGAKPGHDYGRELLHMRGLVEAARDRLSAGASALTVVVETVAALEASGLYIAGRGASPNADGDYELDACVMDGATTLAGAVAGLQGIESPVRAAHAVMERTPHALLVGEGASAFARSIGLRQVVDPDTWYTRAGAHEANHPPPAPLPCGTVGCVVRDGAGRLAAATSTAGVFGKMPGRVGDAPLVGAGTWADQDVAVSCTGQGEYFMRTAVAVQIAHRVRFGDERLQQAAAAALRSVTALGGHGGVIAVDRDGQVAMPFASDGLKRAALLADGTITAAVF